MTLIALVALLGLRALGIIAPVNVWVLVGFTVGGLVVSNLALNWQRARVLPLSIRVGIEVVVITLVIYTTGWGPVLSVGFVFCAAQVVAIEGSPAVFPATIWSLLCLAAAEIAVGFGWAPSVLSPGRSHGIAALMAAGLVFVMRIVWVSARDREAAAVTLAESENRFRQLLVNAADAVVVLDTTGTITFATEAIESLTGYAVDELVGRRDAAAIVFPEDLVRVRGEHQGKLLGEHGRSLRSDMRVQHRDGTLRWCQISATSKIDDPVINGIVINVHDITDRREAAARVAAAEARFRTLVQHAADGIIILDIHARCQYISPSFGRLTGQDESALVGRPVRHFVHPDDVANISSAWKQMLEHPTETTHALEMLATSSGWTKCPTGLPTSADSSWPVSRPNDGLMY